MKFYRGQNEKLPLSWALGIQFVSLIIGWMIVAPAQANEDSWLILKAKQELAKIPLEADVDLIDLDFEGQSFSFRPGFRVAPNQDLKSYSRHEMFEMSLRLSDFGQLTELANTQNLGLGVGLNKTLEAEFVRQFAGSESPFQNQLNALNIYKTPPYFYQKPTTSGPLKAGEWIPLTLDKVPLTAEQAKDLKSTDYFRYTIKAGFSIGASYLNEFLSGTAAIQVNPSYSYVAYGDFQVEVYRLPRERVLVRASSLRSQDHSFRIGIGPQTEIFDFGVSLLDRQLNRIIDRRLIDINLLTHSTGRLFGFEYEFDLSDPVAAQAYDRLMHPKNWRLNSAVKIISPNPWKNENELSQLLLLTIDEVEKLSEQRANLPRAQQTVRRSSISGADFRRQTQSIRVNARIIRASGGQQFEEEWLALKLGPAPTNDFSRYRLNSLTSFENLGGYLFFNRSHRAFSQIDALFGANAQNQINSLQQIVLTHHRNDKRITSKDRKILMGKVRMLIPQGDQQRDPVVRQILQALSSRKRAQVVFELETFISQLGYTLIADLPKDEISRIVDKYFEELLMDQTLQRGEYGDLGLIEEASMHFSSEKSGGCQDRVTYLCALDYYQTQISHLGSGSHTMARIFNRSSGESLNQRWRLLIGLRNLSLFEKVGSGLLLRLAESAIEAFDVPIDYVIGYRLLYRTRKDDEVQELLTERGTQASTLTYREIKRIRARTNNRRFDPELVRHLMD